MGGMHGVCVYGTYVCVLYIHVHACVQVWRAEVGLGHLPLLLSILLLKQGFSLNLGLIASVRVAGQ